MFEYNKDQKYTEKWFDGMIPIWERIFTQHIAPIGVKNVLEIGAGNSPHYKFINHPYKKYYIIETTEIKKNYYKDNPKVLAKKYNGKKIPFKNVQISLLIKQSWKRPH